jgi:hypothetical protein
MADMIDTVEELQRAVETLHECRAQFVETDEVVELFQGKTVWEGTVFIFSLDGHPKATRAYAWSSPIEGSTKRRYYAVLHIPPVDSAEKAVRASIVQDHKAKQTN